MCTGGRIMYLWNGYMLYGIQPNNSRRDLSCWILWRQFFLSSFWLFTFSAEIWQIIGSSITLWECGPRFTVIQGNIISIRFSGQSFWDGQQSLWQSFWVFWGLEKRIELHHHRPQTCYIREQHWACISSMWYTLFLFSNLSLRCMNEYNRSRIRWKEVLSHGKRCSSRPAQSGK